MGIGLLMIGVKELDTGLAQPNLWDLPADKQRMGEEHPLQVPFL
jgi:26S proteasome regulatory subunit T1